MGDREKLMIGVQNMGHPCSLLYESRTNLVKFTSLSWPSFCSSMDDIRTPFNPISWFPTYTPTIPFAIDTKYHTNRWTPSGMECGLLDCEHAWGCIRAA
jgi:hypothetical protein